MAKVKIQGNASGTGTVTLTAPNTNNDRTITLPDEDITLGGGVDGIVSTANATAITIDSNERVSVGGTPTSRLVNFTTTDQTDVAIISANNQWSQLCFGDPQDDNIGAVGYDNTNDAMSFTTNTVERLKITSDGRGLSQFTAKAWVNFNGGTASIRDSHNVSSITHTATGIWRVNFSNNMANDDYVVAVTNDQESGSTLRTAGIDYSHQLFTSNFGIRHENEGGVQSDRELIMALVFGD